MSSDRLFRKNVFGGFNKDDVIDYIENMKNEFFDYRSQVETTVNELNKKVASLENELKNAGLRLAEANKKAAEATEKPASPEKAAPTPQPSLTENDPLSEINLATDRLRRVADEICDSLTGFVERIAESSVAVTIAQPLPQELSAAPTATENADEDTKSIISFIDGLLAKIEDRNDVSPQPELDNLLPEKIFK